MEHRRGFVRTKENWYSEVVDSDKVFQIVDTETYMIMNTCTGEFIRFAKYRLATSSNLDEALDYLEHNRGNIIIKVASMTRFVIGEKDD